MKGDIIVLEEHHQRAAGVIVPRIIEQIRNKATRYTITVAGESGSGKSETGKAIAAELEKYDLRSVLLGQDVILFCPPAQTMPKEEKTRTG